MVLHLGGFALVLLMLGYAAFNRSAESVAATVLGVAVYLLLLALVTSFGASATQTAQHEGSPGEVLARCRKLLENHDFEFQAGTADALEAVRGGGAGAETTWRTAPLELRATVAPAGQATLLSVRCTGESGRHRFVRTQIRKTAEAAANLDRASLRSLDRTLVHRPAALFQGGLRPHAYCLPVIKREVHRLAVRKAAVSGSPKFFLGTDSAPHAREAKESGCGCAGIFNAPFALEAYAQVFDEEGALDRFEAFASLNGPAFYGLPANQGTVTLERAECVIPQQIGELVPFGAGASFSWKFAG